jgi:hypothetical protein
MTEVTLAEIDKVLARLNEPMRSNLGHEVHSLLERVRETIYKGGITMSTPELQMAGQGFGAALHLLRQGKRLTRLAWAGSGRWIALENPGSDDPITYASDKKGDVMTWVPSQEDILASDWIQVLAA